jgi:uncharacterized protein YcgI (DUF1989 family)
MSIHAHAERIVVPAAEGRAAAVAAGQSFKVVDVEGGQVGDLFAFAPGDATEYLSASHTRAHTSRLFPSVGEHFVSNRRRPLLELVADDSPGAHDMLIAACDAERYRGLGIDGWHASCAENLRRALASHGVQAPCVPQPVNLFMNIPVDDGRLDWLPAASGPGASVTLRALADVLVVVSACPQDVVAINGGRPTELAIEIVEEATT